MIRIPHAAKRLITVTIAQACALLAILAAITPAARAEYAVLQSGQRIHVTGYERVADTFHLTTTGGTLDIPAISLLRIDPEDTFPAVKIKLLDVPFAKLIASSARTHGVAAELVASVIAVESNFNPSAVSLKSARGLMQLMPGTAARLGVRNVFDPQENIDAGTRYLKELLVRYNGDISLTLAAYNAGPERVAQYRSVPPFRETLDYVRRVTQKYRQASRGSS